MIALILKTVGALAFLAGVAIGALGPCEGWCREAGNLGAVAALILWVLASLVREPDHDPEGGDRCSSR